MKFAAIVLRNDKNAMNSVRYGEVMDEFLSGGVFFDEITLLPYDAPMSLNCALTRLKHEADAIILVCDSALLPYAREQIAVALTALDGSDTYDGDYFVALLPTGEQGKALVTSLVVPAIDRRRNKRYSRMVLRAVGAPSELVSSLLEEAKGVSGDSIVYNVSDRFGDLRIEAVYDSATPKMTADDVLRMLASGLKDYLYAVQDVSLAERLIDALKLRRMRIATAESFTGGGVGREIVKIPGASAVFFEGLNTYDNRSKEERLGVSPFKIKSEGAVSDEVAYEMAAGLLKSGNCELAVATTGIAGPQSDNSKKPAGLCYIAVGTKERVRVYRFHLEGDRERVTETAINLALFYAYQEIK